MSQKVCRYSSPSLCCSVQPNISIIPALQLPTPLVGLFMGCLLSDPIPLPKRKIICRLVFEQITEISSYNTQEYFTDCILSETQKEKKINILHNKQIQLNNTADTNTINKHLAPVNELFILSQMFHTQNHSSLYIGVASYGALGHVPPSPYNNFFSMYLIWHIQSLTAIICRQSPRVNNQ